MCERSQFNPDMCRFCTKLRVSKKKISDYINSNLYVEIHRFPMQLSEEMVAAEKIYLFSHTNVVGCREDPFGVNLGGLCYESISSHFCFGNFIWFCSLGLYLTPATGMFYRYLFQTLTIVIVESLLYVTLKTAEILSQVRLNQTFMKKLLFVKE